MFELCYSLGPVSYTHLDVYKRQIEHCFVGAKRQRDCGIHWWVIREQVIQNGANYRFLEDASSNGAKPRARTIDAYPETSRCAEDKHLVARQTKFSFISRRPHAGDSLIRCLVLRNDTRLARTSGASKCREAIWCDRESVCVSETTNYCHVLSSPVIEYNTLKLR